MESSVDTAWTCGCGSLNAGSRETCYDCDKLSPSVLTYPSAS